MGTHKSAIEQAESDANDRMDGMDTDISALEAAMAVAQSDIDTLEGQMSAAQSSISAAQANIATLLSQMAAAQSAITTAQGNITTIQGQITALQTGKANVSGQVFTGAISATNLSGTNTGNQIAASATVTYTNTSLGTIGGVVVLGISVVDVTTMNAKMATIESKLNALGADDANLRLRLQTASPSPLMA